jgi:hypothetical protein
LRALKIKVADYFDTPVGMYDSCNLNVLLILTYNSQVSVPDDEFCVSKDMRAFNFNRAVAVAVAVAVEDKTYYY